jgi:hypothetical protein
MDHILRKRPLSPVSSLESFIRVDLTIVGQEESIRKSLKAKSPSGSVGVK